MSIGRTIFQLGFEISPIILTGGIASLMDGDMLPIVALTEAPNFITGLLTGNTESSLDDFFAHFRPLQGTTLIDNAIGSYPFANQAIAANAIITQPLRVSFVMVCPAKTSFGYATKLATMAMLQSTIQQHTNQGGTYTLVTPSNIYANCILTGLRDISTGESQQPQISWQWDFVQPLVSLQQAQAAQSQLMSKLTNGLPTDGSWSGPGTQVGSQLGGAGSVATAASTPLAGTSATSGGPVGGIPGGGGF